MNERPLKSGWVQKLSEIGFYLPCAFWFAIIAFSAAPAFAQAKFRAALASSDTPAATGYPIPSGSYLAISENAATDAQSTLGFTVARTRTIAATGSESLVKPRGHVGGLPPIQEQGTGMQVLGGLAFLLWIQRLRRYWV